jgi:hypothetical protein
MVLGKRLAATSLEVEWSARLESGDRMEGKKREEVGSDDAVEMLAHAWEAFRQRDCPG